MHNVGPGGCFVQYGVIVQAAYIAVYRCTYRYIDLLKEPQVWYGFHKRLTPDHRNVYLGII